MGLIERIKRFMHHPGLQRMEDHTREVKHDLTNLRARADVISRLFAAMHKEDDSPTPRKQNGI